MNRDVSCPTLRGLVDIFIIVDGVVKSFRYGITQDTETHIALEFA
jgi:hypothetical protein